MKLNDIIPYFGHLIGPSIDQAQQYNNTRKMSSDSSLSSQGRQKKRSKRKAESPNAPRRSFQPAELSSQLLKPSRVSSPPRHSPPIAHHQPTMRDETNLFDENRKLRHKLKELSRRLDQQLQRAAENKLKFNNAKNGHPVSLDSQNMELQNAYKMIERLQKTVHDYESKESYQVTLKRVLDLESIIKKKEQEVDQLKSEVKTQKKMLKDKDKHVEELLDNTKRMGNPAEDKEVIHKLKTKLKKVSEDNEQLRKKELQKHQKLVRAERKVVQLQQDIQMPIGKQEELIKDVQEWKKKYKETMQRVDRQNIYISKLNQKLTKEVNHKSRKSQRLSEKHSQRGDKRIVARSMEDLPSLQKRIITSQLLQHLPSPKQGAKLRRY